MLSWLARKLEVHIPAFTQSPASHNIQFKMSTLTAAVAQVFCLLQLMMVAAALRSDGDLCPTTEMTSGSPMVTSFLSFVGSGMEICGLQYVVPARATLYQGMLAADLQHISFYSATMMLTPVGVDFIHVKNGSAYIWQYSNNSDHTRTYSGPCNGPSTTPPTSPLIYKIMSLTVSGADVKNDTFKPACKQPVLIAPNFETITVFKLLEQANRQIPILVKAGLNEQNDFSVTSFNGVANRGGYLWTGYKDGSNEPIPYDLSLTSLTDGGHVEFKYENSEEPETGPPGGAPSVAQSVTLLTLAGLLANLMTSVY